MHVVTATVSMKTKPDQIEAMKQVAVELVDYCQKEEGCRLYYFQQSQADPTRFLLYMQWIDQTRFEKHLKNPLVQKFDTEQAEQLLAEPFQVTHWTMVS